jgi:hypothetical protein
MLDADEHLHPTQANAYVDDLNSVSSTLTGLQHKANVVSAFCCIFCIILNAKKFRAFHINWGNSKNQPDSSIITIHTDGWQPTTVPLATDGSLTHLGLKRDCNLDDVVQFFDLYTKTSAALGILAKANVSVAAKLMVIKTVIYPRIRYIGKGVCWQYRAAKESYAQFDKLIYAAVQRITRNRLTYPTALLEASAEHEGHGIPPVSVDCQLAKLADLRRAMTRSSHHRHTMMSLVNNVLKAVNQPLIARQVRIASLQRCDTWWLSSAIEFLHSIGLTITINNKRASSDTVLLKQAQPHMSVYTEKQLFLSSIASHQELFMEGDHPSQYLQTLIDELQLTPIRKQHIPLRADQTWAIYRDGRVQIHQLMGRLTPGVWQSVRWLSSSAEPQIGNSLTLVKGTAALVGAGGVDTLDESLFDESTSEPHLLTLSSETYRLNGSHTAKIVDMRRRTPILEADQLLNPPATIRPKYHDWLADSQSLAIFTDGSFRRTGTTADQLMGTSNPHCQSSIVKRNRNGVYSYIAITNDNIKHGSAYTTELIAQIIALWYTNGEVNTDCEAAIKALRKPKAASHPLIQLAPKNQATRLTHVEAHPELVKAAADYTPKDKGIFLADMIAGGDLGKADMLFDESASLIVSDIQIIHDLSNEVDVPFVSTLGGHLNLEPLLQRYQRLSHEAYLRRRDLYKLEQASAEASPSPVWSGTSFSVTHNLFKKSQQERVAVSANA